MSIIAILEDEKGDEYWSHEEVFVKEKSDKNEE